MNVNNQNKSSDPESARYLKKTQVIVIAACFIVYVMLFPTLVVSLKEDLSFLSNYQTRAKIFYSSLYSMCGSFLASLILIIFPVSETKRSFGLIALLLFSTCPLAVRFLDSNFEITHGPFTAFWVEINTLSYAYFIRKMDLAA